MEQDSESQTEELVLSEQDYDVVTDEQETDEIRQRIEAFGLSKRHKTELVRWIKKTPEGLYREKQIWHAIQYFNRLKDFNMSRRLAELEARQVERATAFYLVAIATKETMDIAIARQQLAAARSVAPDSCALAKIGQHHAVLFSITDDPKDLAWAGRVAEDLMAQGVYDYAGDVFMDMIEVHPITGLFLQAREACVMVASDEDRSDLLWRLYCLLERCPPVEYLGPLIENLIKNSDPDVQELIQPFITDRLCAAVYCALYRTTRKVGTT